MERILFVLENYKVAEEIVKLSTDKVKILDAKSKVDICMRYGVRIIPTLVEDNGQGRIKKIAGNSHIKKYLNNIRLEA
jgi:hypothetical protein